MLDDVVSQTSDLPRSGVVVAAVGGVGLEVSVVVRARAPGARVRVIHERVVAAFAPERDPVRRAALHVRHRPDVSSVLGVLRERRERDHHLWLRL